MVDSSYFELFKLITRPLTEEFDPPWNHLRSVFWGVTPLVVLSLATALVMEDSPEYQGIRDFFFNLSLITGALVAILYCLFAVLAYRVQLIRRQTKEDRLRRFQD